MSYNITKVSTKEPNSSGDITLNLEDVTSVSSPSDGQTLGYNGTNWVNRIPNWVNEAERGTNSTSGSGSSIESNMPLTFSGMPTGFDRALFWWKAISTTVYTGHVDNSDNDTTLLYFQQTSTTSLYYGVQINNAGVYRLYIKFPLDNTFGTDNSSAVVQWSNADNTVTYGPRFRIHKASMKSVQGVGIINASGGEKICLYKHAINNTPKSPLGSSYADYLLIVEKLS
jgi:hypothetical protein